MIGVGDFGVPGTIDGFGGDDVPFDVADSDVDETFGGPIGGVAAREFVQAVDGGPDA